MSNEGINVDVLRREGRDEARQDATTRRLNDNEMRGTTRDKMQCNDMVWRCNGMGCATTRGRETSQQPTKETNERTNKQTKRAEREATTWQEVKM
jgi:hypothetical protein